MSATATQKGSISTKSWVEWDKPTKSYIRHASFKIEPASVWKDTEGATQKVLSVMPKAAELLHKRWSQVSQVTTLDEQQDYWSESIRQLAQRVVHGEEHKWDLQHQTVEFHGTPLTSHAHATESRFHSGMLTMEASVTEDLLRRARMVIDASLQRGTPVAELTAASVFWDENGNESLPLHAVRMATPTVYYIDCAEQHLKWD